MLATLSHDPAKDGGGKLPPPPDDPGDNRWDNDDLGPARNLFNQVVAQMQQHFESQPWFAGIGMAGLPVESGSRIDSSLNIDDQFREMPQGWNKATGIVVQVIDRTTEQIADIKREVTELLAQLNAQGIPFVVLDRDVMGEAIEFEAATLQRDQDLETLRLQIEISSRITLIQPAKHPEGPFWIVVPNTTSTDERRQLSTLIEGVITRRFQVIDEGTWKAIAVGSDKPSG